MVAREVDVILDDERVRDVLDLLLLLGAPSDLERVASNPEISACKWKNKFG